MAERATGLKELTVRGGPDAFMREVELVAHCLEQVSANQLLGTVLGRGA
jgi:hypothetical protein